MSKWLDEYAMGRELLVETMDRMVAWVSEKIGDGCISLPPLMMIASKGEDPYDESPDLAAFLIESFEEGKKLQAMEQLGMAVALSGLQIAASFFVTEAWQVSRTLDEGIQGRPSQQPDRKEIVQIFCKSINNENLAAFLSIGRNLDTNAMILTEVVRHYPEPGQSDASLTSPLMTTYMSGYVGALHLLIHGTPLDPKAYKATKTGA